MALLFECMGRCCRNTLDTADIVRDACYQQVWSLVGIGPMQVYSIPDAMRQTLIPTLVMVMLATCSTLADVRVEPTFGHPYVFGHRIVFIAVDRIHLIAIDQKG